MQKNGRVEIGKTPSVVSGKKSARLIEGEAVCAKEKPVDPGMKKLASFIGDLK
jgi:hypothetical protein